MECDATLLTGGACAGHAQLGLGASSATLQVCQCYRTQQGMNKYWCETSFCSGICDVTLLTGGTCTGDAQVGLGAPSTIIQGGRMLWNAIRYVYLLV